ncbi:MAG: helix-turn-helix domain-containing protein [Coriobacteriia bacterium]|nr:helix-turn-helix domain-containing protein [Coriobacteriia bacterium]
MAETFGVILAEARMNKGLSLEQVSDVLRIRPAILAALEREDYYGMPLKGHSRNMVSTYSRFLGLDSAAVTELFLQNYRDFEHAEAIRRRETQRVPIEPRNTLPPASTPIARKARDSASSTEQGVRSIWDKPTPQSELHTGYDSRSPRSQRSAKNAARRRSVQGSMRSTVGVNESRPNVLDPNALRSEGRSTVPRVMRGDSPKRKGLPGTVNRLMTTTPLPLILLVLAVVAILVFWAVVANSCNSKPDSYIPIQSSGNQANNNSNNLVDDPLMNPSSIDDEQAGPNYGPFELRVEPASGSEPWTEIYVDGEKKFEGYLDETQTYEVKVNCEVRTGMPGSVKVYRDDELQEFETGDGGVGIVGIEVENRPINDNTTNTPVE